MVSLSLRDLVITSNSDWEAEGFANMYSSDNPTYLFMSSAKKLGHVSYSVILFGKVTSAFCANAAEKLELINTKAMTNDIILFISIQSPRVFL